MNLDSEGNITFSIFDLLDGIEAHQVPEVINYLACTDAVITHVVDQLIDGETIAGCSGSESSGAVPSTPLSIAKDKIAKGANDVARKRIEELERLVASKEQSLKDAWEEIHRLNGNDNNY